MHALRRGSWNTQRLRAARLERLVAPRILNRQLIAAAAVKHQLHAVVTQQCIERADIRPHGARRDV